MYFFRSFLVVLAIALLASGCRSPDPAVVAEVIYAGGPIVTLNDALPNAEALAVRDGTILAVNKSWREFAAANGAVALLARLFVGPLPTVGCRHPQPVQADAHEHPRSEGHIDESLDRLRPRSQWRGPRRSLTDFPLAAPHVGCGA